MLDWLIVGGGIQGTYLSLYLTRHKGIPPEQIRVLDPYPEPLALWEHFTRNSGMEFLRSSHAHNLHFDPFSLVTFTRTLAGEKLARFIEPYGRPSLELFRAHNEWLIGQYRLRELRLTGRARKLTRRADGWRVETENGAIDARQVVLAIGYTESPHWPEWGRQAQNAEVSIRHLFDPAFDRVNLRTRHVSSLQRVVVVGGGITAAQAALALAIESPGNVTLLMRHPPRVHQFDADIGWITHQHLDSFHQQRDYARRRDIIQRARHRGSMPADVARELARAVENGLLICRQDEVVSLLTPPQIPPRIQGGALRDVLLPLSNRLERGLGGEVHLASGDTLLADHIILATGFDSARPGGEWLDNAIADYELPTAPDGYPMVDRTLCWSPGLFVTGPLAELEIGPVSRNLVGIKLAAERIGESI